MGTQGLEVITNLIDKVGLLPMILSGFGATSFFKNLIAPENHRSIYIKIGLLLRRILHNGVINNLVRIGSIKINKKNSSKPLFCKNSAKSDEKKAFNNVPWGCTSQPC